MAPLVERNRYMLRFRKSGFRFAVTLVKTTRPPMLDSATACDFWDNHAFGVPNGVTAYWLGWSVWSLAPPFTFPDVPSTKNPGA